MFNIINIIWGGGGGGGGGGGLGYTVRYTERQMCGQVYCGSPSSAQRYWAELTYNPYFTIEFNSRKYIL